MKSGYHVYGVIGSDGEMVGVLSRDEALAMAEKEGIGSGRDTASS